MNIYNYKGVEYTIKELSEMSGIQPHTLRQRLRNGYDLVNALKQKPIHTSVEVFCEDSWYRDWESLTIDEVYQIYCNWCDKNDYNITPKQTFGKEIQMLYPIYTVPTFNKGSYMRVIRLR